MAARRPRVPAAGPGTTAPYDEALLWLVGVLTSATTTDDVSARVAPRLTGRGDLVAFLSDPGRFGGWRGARPVEVSRRHRAPEHASVVFQVGDERWELDVAVEDEPPHRITRVVPRRVPDGARPWTDVRDLVRAADRVESNLAADAAASIGQLLDEARDARSLPGLAVSVLLGGERVHRSWLGVTDLDSGSAWSAEDTVDTGSVAKLVTALGVQQLVGAGSLALDTPYAELVDSPLLVPVDPADRSATVADLLVHAAGAPRDFARAVARALVDGQPLARTSPTIRLTSAPGARTDYSNVGYQLLGELLETVTGSPYQDLLERDVLGAWGLGHSSLQRPPAAQSPGVTGYLVVAGELAPAAPRRVPHPAAGGLLTCVADLEVLAGALAAGTGGPAGPLFEVTAAHGPHARFTAGFALLDRAAGPVAWRAGQTAGYTTDLHAWPGTGDAVVVVASASPAGTFHDLAEEVRAAARGVAA